MPKGLSKIAQLAAEAQKRSDAYAQGGDYLRALVLKKEASIEGRTARGRFLEEGEGVWYIYTHELPKKPGQRFGDRVLCLDQEDEGTPCPGCEIEGVSKTARVVINFIRYDEPKLRRDKDGKAVKDAMGNYIVDGTEPTLVVWNAPQSAGGRLQFLESQHGGLTNHVCTIHRTQDDKNPWMIDVVEKNKEPEDFERKLFEKKVEPIKAITQLGKWSIPLMSYGDMKRAYGGSVASGFAQDGTPVDQPPSDNIYAQAAAKVAGQGGNLNLGAFGS